MSKITICEMLIPLIEKKLEEKKLKEEILKELHCVMDTLGMDHLTAEGFKITRVNINFEESEFEA